MLGVAKDKLRKEQTFPKAIELRKELKDEFKFDDKLKKEIRLEEDAKKDTKLKKKSSLGVKVTLIREGMKKESDLWKFSESVISIKSEPIKKGPIKIERTLRKLDIKKLGVTGKYCHL